ncbi:MAG: response regulator, partial [Lentimicrobium sp.]|nr:response regulator [Lentimicrobium sp.]
MLATISHEIRNPFNLALGYTELLKETPLNDTQRNYVNIISSSSVSLFDVINKSLQFTNIYFKQLNINYQLFELRSLFEDVKKRFTFEANKKNLKFKVTISDVDELRIFGDKARLNDILSYLLSNAIKFTERGEVALEINIKTISERECLIHFSISDTGKGFDVSTIERILRYFGQEDNGISRNYGGLGLGLSIAQYLIIKMGGKLTIDSSPGIGSTFMFDLKCQIDNQHVPSYLLNLRNLNPELTAKIKILLVDDDPYQRDMGKEILKEWNLTFAENGQEAVNLLKQGAQFDLILMDIRMPVMDGITATKIIREELKSKIIIIALSGEAIRESIEESEKAGMNAFVSKPYDKEKLIYSIVSNLQIPVPKEIGPLANKLTGIANMQALIVVSKIYQLVLSGSLENSSCKFDTAESLYEASKLINGKFYDFILLDLDLIDNNIELISKNAKTVIIAYTTDDADLTRKMCTDLNIDGILIKESVTAANFQSNIREIIDFRPLKQKITIQTTDRIYDLSSLQKYIGKDESGLKELINIYLDHMPTYIKQLRTALQNHDYEQLSRVAHSLKSTAKQ